MNIKKMAFSKYVKETTDYNIRKITTCGYDDNMFEIESEEYKVLTEDEADKQAKECILDTLWAFNYSFLCCHSKEISQIPEEDFTKMQGKLCESFNAGILAMIDDQEHFIKDAIRSDGRGHFLSGYDGEENEVKFENQMFYIYRTN